MQRVIVCVCLKIETVNQVNSVPLESAAAIIFSLFSNYFQPG